MKSLLLLLLFANAAFAAEPLPSWNDTAPKQAIVAFVEKVTKAGSPNFVPVAERIATFDNDGTLWAEQPMYFQLLFSLDRVKALAPQHPEWKDKEPFASLLKGDVNLGELVITLDGGKLTVESYRLYPIDDTIAGDRAIAEEIEKLKKSVTAAVFASRGYSIDQPLAVIPRDLPNTFADIAAGTILANLCTDAFRKATKADIGFSVKGLMRTGLTRGKTGVQTVYDVFAVAPLG